jgi:hypothetical protein
MDWLESRWKWVVILILAISIVIGGYEKHCQSQAYQCRANYAAQARIEAASKILSVNEQAAEQEAIATACEPNGYFCRLFGAANLPTVLLVIGAAAGIWAAWRTLDAIKRQADLQQAQMQQWVDVGDWKVHISVDEKNLLIQFNIVNPSNFPLTVKECVLKFGISENRLSYSIGENRRLLPKKIGTHAIQMWITREEAGRFMGGVLPVFVRGTLIHTDMGNFKGQSVPQSLDGTLICGMGRGARFEPETISPSDKNEEQEAD